MYNTNTKSILSDFFSFLKKPNDQQVNLSTKDKLLVISKLLVLELLFTLIIILPINYLISNLITVKSERLDYKYNTIYAIILLMVIIAPFLEEIAFRSILRYNSVFAKLISRQKWDQYFPLLVYSMSILFGVVHASNFYNDTWLFYALSPLIILSQLSGGFILSYIRVRINFYYGFLHHALWNFVALLIMPFIILLFTNPFTDHTKNYNLEIDENIVFHQNEVQTIIYEIKD